jgi:spermidine synthase
MQRLRFLYLTTLFAGSFLLFLVQPLVARLALPRLGGAPAVWNSAMLVYQLLLLGGYAYAHMLARRPPRQQAVVHVALFALAALWLPLSLSRAEPPPGTAPALWVPWLLVSSIGPLFFVVSAQAPLMQRWFDLAGGGEPYALYAASNLGSLLGLLAYPLVLEPRLRVGAQTLLWSAGYVLLALLVLAATLTLRSASARPQEAPGTLPRPGAALRLRWLVLSAVPSGLMLSTTTHLTTDIVAVPLLWVVPLALYLLSFTLAFATRRRAAELFTKSAPLVLLVGGSFAFTSSTDYPAASALLGLGVLLWAAVALHGELYRTRPAAQHLTEFYMIMSLGGVLGGALCALIAPLVFDWAYEHPLLVLLAAALSPPVLGERAALLRAAVARLAPWLVAAALAASLVGGGVLWRGAPGWVPYAATALVFALTLVCAARGAAYVACFALLMASGGGWSSLELSAAGVRERSYFGIYTVLDGAQQERVLNHGTTVHGVQSTRPGRELDATTYYGPRSGVGLALTAAGELFPAARVGLVGLGAGTLACYRRPGQHYRFYEIDPVVVRIARDPRKFTFLARCAPDAPLLLGDARLLLEREPAQSLDVLVVDAFSSDTVPVHLLTREAFAVYARALVPSGLLVVHVSNRHFTLDDVVVTAAAPSGFRALLRAFRPDAAEKARHQTGSRWIALSRDARTLGLLHAIHRDAYKALSVSNGSTPWTDDYASILPLLFQ